jgi:hypothetical protein
LLTSLCAFFLQLANLDPLSQRLTGLLGDINRCGSTRASARIAVLDGPGHRLSATQRRCAAAAARLLGRAAKGAQP